MTRETVRRRLAAAVDLIESTTARPGPKGPRSAWPAVQLDARDLWWQSQSDDNAARRNRWRIGATAEEIRLAEEALGWLALLKWPAQRRALQLWMRARAMRVPFSAFAEMEPESYVTLRRRLADGFDEITDRLK